MAAEESVIMLPMANDFEPVTIPELVGRCGKVYLRLLNTPFLRSPSRNIIMFLPLPNDDFHLFMLEAIDKNIRAKEKTGFFLKKTYYCRQCNEKLAPQQEQQHQFEFNIHRCEIPVFQVQLEIPAVMCASCGTFNVIETFALSSDIIDAQMEAFNSLPGIRY
jgi:hypothetical protein